MTAAPPARRSGRRSRLAAVALITTLTFVPAGAVVATEVPPPSVPTSSENEFIPEDVNITDCVSAVPRPDCGSNERGGWRQGLVFGVLAAALVAIGVPLAIGIRRRDRVTRPVEGGRSDDEARRD